MPRTCTDQAVVLRTWSVGETDRFCIVLTKEHGKIALRVPGARRLLSRRGRGLLPLHIVDVTWSEQGSMRTVTSASCVQPNSGAWRNIDALAAAEKGIELVLHLTEEHASVPTVYDLTLEFLSLCPTKSTETLTLFVASLLHHMGNFPVPTHSHSSGVRFLATDEVVWSSASDGFVRTIDDPYGLRLPNELRTALSSLERTSLSIAHTLSPESCTILRRMVDRYSPIQLGTSFSSSRASPPRILANSSAVTPT